MGHTPTGANGIRHENKLVGQVQGLRHRGLIHMHA